MPVVTSDLRNLKFKVKFSILKVKSSIPPKRYIFKKQNIIYNKSQVFYLNGIVRRGQLKIGV